MSDVAVRAEGLGKRYRIGRERERYGTLRDTVVAAAAAPFRRLRSAATGKPTEFWALRDISFELKQGQVLGIIGRNGAGKSTLLKILARITEPTRGLAEIDGRVGSLLEVGTGFHPELTGRENTYLNGAILGMKRVEIDRKFDEIVEFAEVRQFLDTPVKRYSSGMYMRLAFSIAAHLEPEVLIVDEVLAVGDAEFQKKSLGKMGDVAKRGRTVLFVSHNLNAVTALCDSAILLERGRLVDSGPSAEVVSRYQAGTLGDGGGGDGSVLYALEGEAHPAGFAITEIEMLELDGAPKQHLRTWDPVRFRVHYHAPVYVRHGSVVLQIASTRGTPLILTSTNPDHAVQMDLRPGHSYADCVIDAWPLAADVYSLGAGIARPKVEWLFRADDLCSLTVLANDVFNSGQPQTGSRAFVVTPHHWEVP